MSKKEGKLGLILATIPIVLVMLILGGILFFVYLWRFAGYQPTIEEVLSTSNILKTIAILIVVFGIALVGINKNDND